MIEKLLKMQFIVALKCTPKQYDKFMQNEAFDIDEYAFDTSYPDIYYDFELEEISFDCMNDRLEAETLEHDVMVLLDSKF